MRSQRVRTLVAIAGAALLGVACEKLPTIPQSDPTITGVIKGPGDLGTLMVVAGEDSTSCSENRRLQVGFSNADILWRSGGRASASELYPGVTISAWITGVILDVCPGIASAKTIVIEGR